MVGEEQISKRIALHMVGAEQRKEWETKLILDGHNQERQLFQHRQNWTKNMALD